MTTCVDATLVFADSSAAPLSLDNIAGVDEAGRGALAGPVAAAAVVLPADFELPNLTDSKKLTPAQRGVLATQIRACACTYAVAFVSAREIDRINILQASLLAMAQAVARLSGSIAHVLVDGRHCPQVPYPATAVVGGDARFACISAASVLAKEARDAWMRTCDAHEPRYQFARHKGYPSPVHLKALAQFGPGRQHRLSYKPVRTVVEERL